MKKPTLYIVIVILIIIVGYFLFFNKATWTGFYYPDAQDLTKSIQSPVFKSIEECRAWIDNQIPIYNPSSEGYDYECGKNCKFDKDYQIYICKETLR